MQKGVSGCLCALLNVSGCLSVSLSAYGFSSLDFHTKTYQYIDFGSDNHYLGFRAAWTTSPYVYTYMSGGIRLEGSLPLAQK